MKIKSLFIFSCLSMIGLLISAQNYKFQNTKLSDEKRIDALMEELTLDEKSRYLAATLLYLALVFCLAVTTRVCMAWHWEVLPLGVDGKKVRTGELFPPIVLQPFSLNPMGWALHGTLI